MNLESIIMLAVSALTMLYLIYALLRPPLRHFSYRAFARAESQTDPITDRARLALVA